ncbi:hypothetical protein, partial [Escherichia coli]|uniref:hypothetical protein n=1 Tax=Escherichia coli TaxID=562 RepID=UPI0019D36CA9
GAVRPPVEAGTHRNDSGDSLNVAGIHVLQGVEDVKAFACVVFKRIRRPQFLLLNKIHSCINS